MINSDQFTLFDRILLAASLDPLLIQRPWANQATPIFWGREYGNGEFEDNSGVGNLPGGIVGGDAVPQ